MCFLRTCTPPGTLTNHHCLSACLPVPSCCLLQPVPALLEIPSKDSPYDPNQDSLLRRVKLLLGLQ